MAYLISKSFGIFETKYIKPVKQIYKENINSNFKTPPITVSNHQSFIDIFFFMFSEKCYSSFLSKEEIKKIPFIGAICTAMQSLYVKRTDKNDRTSIINLIEERFKNN